MKLRERWKQARKRRKRINEAIEKGLTAEQKLALLESRQPTILRNLPLLLFMVVAMGAFVYALAIANIGYGLRYHFGENVWENMVEAGKVEFGSSGGNPYLVIWVLAGLAFFLLAIGFYDMFQEDKEEKRLKREILGRIKAGGN